MSPPNLIYPPSPSRKDSELTIPYENLRLDHMAQLSAEGYSQRAVLRALTISQNDIQIARNILNEYVNRAW